MTPSFPRHLRILLCGGLVLLFVAGCSGGRKRPHTVAVSGKVTYNNKPLAGAQVGFVSKLDNRDVISAHGMTSDSGEYSLTTYLDPQHEVSGATPGDFIVTVTKVDKIDSKDVMANFSKGNPTMKGFFKKLIPDKYGEAKQSDLKATVTEKGNNKFDFDLKD